MWGCGDVGIVALDILSTQTAPSAVDFGRAETQSRRMKEGEDTLLGGFLKGGRQMTGEAGGGPGLGSGSGSGSGWGWGSGAEGF